jgi:copper transport protein
VFGVGDVDVDRGALGRVTADGADRTWEVVGAWGRGFAYAGTLVAAGGTAFLVLIHRGGDDRRALRRVVRVAAGAGAVGVLASLPVQAALGTGQGPGSLFDDGVLGEVSRDGVGLGVVLALMGLVVAVAVVDRLPWLALGGAALAAGSFATNGHTRGGTQVALATTADVVHLLVAAAWAGGLVLLLTALQQRRRAVTTSGDTVGLVGRFSSLATVTVLAVGVSGGALAWTEVGTWGGLTSSTYGRLVLAKVAIVAVIVALGAYNHFRLVPALRAGGKTTAGLRRLRSTLAWEVLLLVAVVAVTSVLVVVTPARTLAEVGVVERDVDLGDPGRVQVTVDPAQVGQNTIHLYLFDPDGRPADIAETVTLELSLPSADLGPITREATRAGPAHFQLDTGDLAVAGDWALEVRARVDRFTEATGTTEVPVAR